MYLHAYMSVGIEVWRSDTTVVTRFIGIMFSARWYLLEMDYYGLWIEFFEWLREHFRQYFNRHVSVHFIDAFTVFKQNLYDLCVLFEIFILEFH